MNPQDRQSELEVFLKFLGGSGEYKGRWFGDRPNGTDGAYFWRKDLRPIIEAYVTTRVKEAERLATAELRTWYGDMFQQLINQIGYEKARQIKDAIEANTLTTTTNGKGE